MVSPEFVISGSDLSAFFSVTSQDSVTRVLLYRHSSLLCTSLFPKLAAIALEDRNGWLPVYYLSPPT